MDVIKSLPNWLLGIGLIAVAILVAVQMLVGGAVVCSDGTWFGKCSMESRLLASAILLTEGECKQLGDKWNRFEPAAGRFAIASGENQDINGVTRTFVVGQEDQEGEYENTLTAEELPEHMHQYEIPRYGRSKQPGGSTETHYADTVTRDTTSSGKNEAHNNMPPYVVLNFCVQTQR